VELVSAFEAVALLGVLLWVQARRNSDTALFYALLLAAPVFIAFKNGFVRQDMHIIIFFCFMELALALVLLTVQMDRERAWRVAPLILLSVLIWQDQVFGSSARFTVETASGLSSARAVHAALQPGRLRQRLHAYGLRAFPESERLEPELVQAIGDSPVASLSASFTNLAAAGLRVSLYPVIQRYSAFTPRLDKLNAGWVRDKGPKFLVFDGDSIDERDPWAETPAMWLEIYRWYDARLLGSTDLLFERRAVPRFGRLEPVSHFKAGFPLELRPPASHEPLFWTMSCGYSALGRIEKLLFRVPGTFVSVVERGGHSRRVRVMPEVLVSPVPGNYWPGDLAQFASVFKPDPTPDFAVDKIVFDGFGMSAYSAACEVEFLRTAR
jgi:hypothetical protein